jgi:hypothetical protein
MTVVVIAYPPSAGGNHLKNMLCIDPNFANSNDLDQTKYTNGDREVHSTPGRNIQEYKITAAENSASDYIIHGHFGELAIERNRINAIADKKFIVVTIDTERDRYLLSNRQGRLGQMSHPYYLDEEQPYLYQPYFYQTYFTGQPENIYTIALNDFWHPDLTAHNIIPGLNTFLNKNVDQEQAQVLHNHWHINNDINYY